MLNKLDNWITQICLDLYDWYTKNLINAVQELKNAK